MTGRQRKEYDRYSNYWDWTCNLTRAIQGGLCAYPGCDRSIYQVHHAVYQEYDEFKRLVPIKGRERPGVHCFGLCKFHHSKQHRLGAHHPINWEKGVIPPDRLDAKQKPGFYRKLLEGFKEKREKAEKQNAIAKNCHDTQILSANSTSPNF